MAPTPYFGSITSPSAFNAHFKSERQKDFVDLKYEPASDWGRGHLFACRVLRHEFKGTVLPVLSPHVEKSDLKSPDEINEFLKGPGPGLLNESEHHVVRNSNLVTSLAHVWAALAVFKGKEPRNKLDLSSAQEEDGIGENSDAEARYPSRDRQQTSHSCYVNSSNSLPEDSSFSSSSQASSTGYVGRDTHCQSTTAEDNTVRLASCVVRHILYFAGPQSQALEETVVEFRDAKIRLAIDISDGGQQIVAIDDGGLCLRQQIKTGGFQLRNNHVAILEAKTKFHQFNDEGQPTISDGALGQMVCEALATKLSYKNLISDKRYAISRFFGLSNYVSLFPQY